MAPPDLSWLCAAEDADPPEGRKGECHLRSGIPGEPFGKTIEVKPVNLRSRPKLRFRYRASPGLMANLYLTLFDQRHCLVFSAPGITGPGIPIVGQSDRLSIAACIRAVPMPRLRKAGSTNSMLIHASRGP